MSRKNKNFRAWQQQNPSGTCHDAWDAAWKSQGSKAYSNKIGELQAENERLRRPACGTEENWLKFIRHDDDQALLWFRAMQRESEDKKKAMEDAERYRLARKFEFLTDRQLLSIDAAMEGE